MGAYLSLPAIASYFILPSGGAAFTTLNLLFFYMTWSTLVMSHSPLKIEILGTAFAQLIFFALPSTLFLLLDLAVPSLVTDYKIQGASGLATPAAGSGRNKKPGCWRIAGVSLGNMALSLMVQGGIEYWLTEVLQLRSAVRVDNTLPLPWTMVKEVLLGLGVGQVGPPLIPSPVLCDRLLMWVNRHFITPNTPGNTARRPGLRRSIRNGPTPSRRHTAPRRSTTTPSPTSFSNPFLYTFPISCCDHIF